MAVAKGFPGGSDCKESICSAGIQVTTHGKISWRREWLPTPVFLPEEFHEQRNLVGYSPWDRKELDTTECLTHTHTHTHTHTPPRTLLGLSLLPTPPPPQPASLWGHSVHSDQGIQVLCIRLCILGTPAKAPSHTDSPVCTRARLALTLSSHMQLWKRDPKFNKMKLLIFSPKPAPLKLPHPTTGLGQNLSQP